MRCDAKNCTLLIGIITLQNYVILKKIFVICIHTRFIPSPAYLIVFVKSKTKHRLIRFIIAYLLSDNSIKRETETQTSSFKTYGPPPNSPDLNPLDYRIWEVLQDMFIRNLLKTERWWTEAASDWSMVWNPAKCHWLTMASLPCCMCQSQRKAFWTHAMICCFTTVNNLLWNLYYSFFFHYFNHSGLLEF